MSYLLFQARSASVIVHCQLNKVAAPVFRGGGFVLLAVSVRAYKAFAVYALTDRRVGFVSADGNAAKRAVVLAAAVVLTFVNGAFYAVVSILIHKNIISVS